MKYEVLFHDGPELLNGFKNQPHELIARRLWNTRVGYQR